MTPIELAERMEQVRSNEVLRSAHQDIRNFYGTRRAARSNVPLMNHIDEGLKILDALGSNDNVRAAWCLHPIYQDCTCPSQEQHLDNVYHAHVATLVREYRRVANAALSGIIERSGRSLYCPPIAISTIQEVNDMLVADKVQNRKDFIKHHAGTHPRSMELDLYFKCWLSALGVDDTKYSTLAGACLRAVADLPEVPEKDQ